MQWKLTISGLSSHILFRGLPSFPLFCGIHLHVCGVCHVHVCLRTNFEELIRMQNYWIFMQYDKCNFTFVAFVLFIMMSLLVMTFLAFVAFIVSRITLFTFLVLAFFRFMKFVLATIFLVIAFLLFAVVEFVFFVEIIFIRFVMESRGFRSFFMELLMAMLSTWRFLIYIFFLNISTKLKNIR